MTRLLQSLSHRFSVTNFLRTVGTMVQTTTPKEEILEAASSRGTSPSDPLPRDTSGRYLHLKLKRFSSIKDLTMPYARKTWQENPHDGSVGMASNSRTTCRWCHGKIGKGSLRYQLFLQCHKGCKNSAYFHEGCIWTYPETVKMRRVDEFKGLDDLPEEERKKVLRSFANYVKSMDSIVAEEAGDGKVSEKKRLTEESDMKSPRGKTSQPPKKKRKTAH